MAPAPSAASFLSRASSACASHEDLSARCHGFAECAYQGCASAAAPKLWHCWHQGRHSQGCHSVALGMRSGSGAPPAASPRAATPRRPSPRPPPGPCLGIFYWFSCSLPPRRGAHCHLAPPVPVLIGMLHVNENGARKHGSMRPPRSLHAPPSPRRPSRRRPAASRGPLTRVLRPAGLAGAARPAGPPVAVCIREGIRKIHDTQNVQDIPGQDVGDVQDGGLSGVDGALEGAPSAPRLAQGDTVISTENDSNDSKITV
jgi:hypothetical protein